MSEPKKLHQPIRRGETQITTVSLRRPSAGELRGLKLTDVLQMDVTALKRLLPRITDPALLPGEVEELDPTDLLTLGAGVVGFFVSEAQVQAAEASLD